MSQCSFAIYANTKQGVLLMLFLDGSTKGLKAVMRVKQVFTGRVKSQKVLIFIFKQK